MTDTSITQILHDSNLSQTERLNAIYSACYDEVKSVARRELQKLPNNETITPTVLMHECYLKVLRQQNFSKDINFEDSRHFIFSLAKSMRCYLIDVYRSKKNAQKNDYHQLTLEVGDKDVNFELMDLEYIFDRIEKFNLDYAKLIDLKVFAGLEVQEISVLMGYSERQIIRHWKTIKALIHGVRNQVRPLSI